MNSGPFDEYSSLPPLKIMNSANSSCLWIATPVSYHEKRYLWEMTLNVHYEKRPSSHIMHSGPQAFMNSDPFFLVMTSGPYRNSRP